MEEGIKRTCYEEVEKTAKFLQKKINIQPKIGIICGSGLAGLASIIQNPQTIPFTDVPNFLPCTAPGHKGQIIFGSIQGKEVMCMLGRLHLYEGCHIQEVVFPVRVMKLLGVELLIITNAAGGLNPEYKNGDLVIIKDHINLPGLVGMNPLIGPNDERFGPRFPSISDAYTKEYIKLAKEVAVGLKYDFVKEGVYIGQSGPCYESIAENRFFRTIGADLVGMSTTSEVTVAAHLGMKVLAISVVTNVSSLSYETKDVPDGDEVLEEANHSASALSSLISNVLDKLEV